MTMTRADVLRNVVESQIVFDKFIIPSFVTMEYFGYLHRDVDATGYSNWVQTLKAVPGNYRHMPLALCIRLSIARGLVYPRNRINRCRN